VTWVIPRISTVIPTSGPLCPDPKCHTLGLAVEKHEKAAGVSTQGANVSDFIHKVWSEDQGQDVAEYAVMMAVILVIVVGTVRLIGANASSVFSNVGSAIQ
jgi:Flp pilus assembly pilin Flp